MPTETIEAKVRVKSVDIRKPEERTPLADLADFLRGTHAVVPVAVLGIFLMGMVGFIYFARPFLMPVVLALLLSFLLKPVVRFLARMKLRESVGSLIVILTFLGILSWAVSRLTQPAVDWISTAPETLRIAEGKIHHLLQPAAQLSKAAEKVEDITKPEGSEYTPKVEVKQTHLASNILGYTKSFLAGALETIILLYFLLAAGDLFMHKLVKVMPTLHDKKKAVEIGHELQRNISTYLFTITLINVLLGTVVAVVVKFVGMPNPILWGVVAGLLNFIPYFGPIMGVVILGVAGLVTFDSVGQAMISPVMYLLLHGIEANLVTPLILGRRLTLNPVMIFVSLIFWTWIWGIPGALLSIPMLMMFKIFCDHFKPLMPIGEFLGE